MLNINPLGKIKTRKRSAGIPVMSKAHPENCVLDMSAAMSLENRIKNKRTKKLLTNHPSRLRMIEKEKDKDKVDLNLNTKLRNFDISHHIEPNPKAPTSPMPVVIEEDSLEGMKGMRIIGDQKEKEHYYGSPAIWLKNIKKICDEQPNKMNQYVTRNMWEIKENEVYLDNKSNNGSIEKSTSTLNENSQKIPLYSHQSSLVLTKKNIAESGSLEGSFKSILFRSRLINKDLDKKFSNINQGSKQLECREKSEIDEFIVSGSYLDWSQLQGSFSADHTKISKHPRYPNEMRKSLTNPNSSNGSNNSESNNTDSKFKTLSHKVEMDPYLHQTIEGKIRWKAGEVLSEGTSTVVYKALNEDLGSIFVVKRYMGINNPQTMKSFQNEIKIYQQLDHPNIIKFIDSDIINQNVFIYLEYMSGGSIRFILDRYGPLNENLIRIYLRQLLDGIGYLHSKGIVHRDIKCSNILLDIQGSIKLSDFGCSGQLLNSISDSSSNEEFLSSLKGTLPWCAPEVICEKKYGKKADIWSLGCTLIEMLGSQPWGKLDNVYSAITKIGKSNLIPDIPSNISPCFRDFLLCCLKREPKERANLKVLKFHPFVHSQVFNE